MLGWFTSDPLEKAFGKLRQGSGGTYFLTAQAVTEKLCICRAKLFLQLKLDFPDDSEDGHNCARCSRSLTLNECEILDNLSEFEQKVLEETKSCLIYIAGYVKKKAGQLKENDTDFYYKKHGKYLDALDRGQLIKPQDSVVQWCILCLIFFTQLQSIECRIFVTDAFFSISECYFFGVTAKHCRILSNIFMKNYAILCTPRSIKESSLKVLKLSNT